MVEYRNYRYFTPKNIDVQVNDYERGKKAKADGVL